jgi:DNA-binding HxlR family transcriptional regulator
MVLVKKRRSTLVKQDPPKTPQKKHLQLKIDQILLPLTSPIRISIMKFLNRAKKNGEALQTFMNIQRALEGINPDLSTANLGYHLGELKKVKFIEQIEGECGGRAGSSGGYILTELGRKLVSVYFELEGIHDEMEILHPNDLEQHVYRDYAHKMLIPGNTGPHVTHVNFQPKKEESPIDKFLVNTINAPAKSKMKQEAKKKEFTSLDTFA